MHLTDDGAGVLPKGVTVDDARPLTFPQQDLRLLHAPVNKFLTQTPHAKLLSMLDDMERALALPHATAYELSFAVSEAVDKWSRAQRQAGGVVGALSSHNVLTRIAHCLLDMFIFCIPKHARPGGFCISVPGYFTLRLAPRLFPTKQSARLFFAHKVLRLDPNMITPKMLGAAEASLCNRRSAHVIHVFHTLFAPLFTVPWFTPVSDDGGVTVA